MVLMLNQLSGFGTGGGDKTLISIIQELGLTSGLQLVFDAGDINSYDASGVAQSWFDLSGNAINYQRGTGSGADAADPTFNGTLGSLDETNYWSFDGADEFTTASPNSVADAWAKSTGQFTIVSVVRFAGTTGVKSFAGNATSSVGLSAGFSFHATGSPGSISIQVDKGSASPTTFTTSANYPSGAPGFYAVSWDCPNLTATLQINSTQETSAIATSTVSATPAKDLIIAEDGLGNQLANTDRMYLFACWSTPLTTAQLTALYTALKSRRFPSMA